MTDNDEKYSSLNSEKNNITLVTFIGFQEHLVLNFLRTYLRNGVKEVMLFSSIPQRNATEGKSTIDREIREKAIKLIRDSSGEDVTIIVKEIENIWDFQDYYFQLSRKAVEDAIINLSAGPAVFSAAGMIWALEHGYRVSYSVEYHDDGKLVSSVFSLLDLRPYINSVFSTDNVDKMILSALKKGKSDTLQINRYINDITDYRISLRTVEIHLGKLNKLGIIDITKGRVNKLTFSQKWSKIGTPDRK
ncbi:hypothetical protein Thermo_01098 [Thermoplasmatales archaeon]|nr:hypothetical protein Thermo_01098 [Thermoplasmatales archaeon]